jgi:hypothetical protein
VDDWVDEAAIRELELVRSAANALENLKGAKIAKG